MPDPLHPPDPATCAYLARDFRSLWEDPQMNYRQRLIGYFRQRGLQQADAEDCVQLTALRLVKCWEEFEPALGTVNTWIWLMAYRVYVDFERKKGNLPSTAIEGLLESLTDSPDDAEGHRKAVSGLLREVDKVAKVVLSSDELRVYWELRAGLSVKQIAAKLGISAQRVSEIKYRIIKKLKQAFSTSR